MKFRTLEDAAAPEDAEVLAGVSSVPKAADAGDTEGEAAAT